MKVVICNMSLEYEKFIKSRTTLQNMEVIIFRFQKVMDVIRRELFLKVGNRGGVSLY